MSQGKSNKKVANSLVAMSSAAVLAVYGAGYVRTRSAADRLAELSIERTRARQAPLRAVVERVSAPAPVDPVAAASAPASPHSEQKRLVVITQEVTSSAAPLNTITPVASAVSAPFPAEMPAPVAVPTPAPAPAAAPVIEQPVAIPPAPATPTYRDGKYAGWGRCQHGDIQATVVVDGGRIVSAEISKCQTRYSCDVIEKLPPQVVQRQSYNVDLVGGASESADAFYTAVMNALTQAK